MKNLYTLAIGLIAFSIANGQNINYTVEIENFQQTGCDDGIGDDEEPTWKAWATDNNTVGSFGAGAWQGGTCHSTDDNIPIVYVPGGSLLIYSETNTDATSLDLRFDAWEDDCLTGSRCNYDSGFPCPSGDDCREQPTFAGYNFRDSTMCEWHTISNSQGDWVWNMRFKWEFTDVSSGPLIQETCGDSLILSGQGSGQWSILTGGSGGFSNSNDPTATFGGIAPSTYTLQWASFPDCINPFSFDIQVDLNGSPLPNIATSSTVFCEFATLNFTAANGVTYDWCLNDTANIIANDTTAGAYSLTNTSLNDSIVYVFATDANGCVGIDSLAFTVEVSPSVEIGNDTTICDGGSILLDATDGVPFTGYSWNTSETTPTLNITAPGQYIVTLTHTNSCTNSDTINIGYYSPMSLVLGGAQVMCLGDSVTIDAGVGFVSYLWDDLSINQTNTFFSFGTYNVTVTDTNNCSISDSVVVDPDYFFYSLGADTTISLGAAIDLTANPGISYVWNTSETTQTITVSPSVDDVFTATTLLANGCYEVGTINVFVSEDLNIFIPNMFSPNGDGSNDAFMLYGFGLAEVDFRIFNRWGHEVWSTTDVLELQTMGWDGKSNSDDQPSGTYVWKMTGTTITGAPLSFNGNNQGTILLRR
ncbi:MAG: gliding motility-associated C-terminal domain-containing protein [Flavobacteriales bacterium]|nr:gliding motility-associated C-terminal domain-containing protein [Flavobacteriales bacterium]